VKADRAERGAPAANRQLASTSDERAEIARLRRKNATLREKREILKKAVYVGDRGPVLA
jgi:transposase-like protein